MTENADVRHPSWAGVGRFFTRPELGFVPLAMISLAADHALFGLDPRGFHATNLLLHAASAALAFAIAWLLLRDRWGAFLAASLFALHPLRVESVAWVAERKDVLSVFLYLAAYFGWLRYRAQDRRLLYWAAVVLALLSLLAKGTAVSLPFVMLLTCWYRSGRVSRRDLLEAIPFLLLAVIAAGINLAVQRAGRMLAMRPLASPLDPLLLAARGALFYLWKSIVPTGLSAYYPYPPGDTLPASWWAAPVALALLAAAVLAAGRRHRLVPFGAGFFLLTLFPVLQLVPIGHAVAADRYTYLPALGLGLIAGGALAEIARRRPGWGRWVRIAALALVAVYSLLAWQRTAVFKDSVALWSDALKRAPESAELRFNRGNAFVAAGRTGEALADYDAAIRLDPRHADAHQNRGLVRAARGEADLARADYDRAIALDPSAPGPYNNRGLLSLRAGRTAEALADFERALAREPRYADALYNRGLALSRLGRHAEAAAVFGTALELNPGDAEARARRDEALSRAR